jgi:hypothetical protein
MDRTDTNELIASLAGSLGPVRRLWPPLVRATAWLLFTSVLVAWPVARLADVPAFLARAADLRHSLELGATLLTAIAAIGSAFVLSIPGRARRWVLLPWPPLVLWLATSGVGCVQNGLGVGPPGLRLGPSGDCYGFIVIASLPLAVLLVVALRRARPLNPFPVALCGALGVAAFAAFLLQFFHPFGVTVVDLGLHVAAVATIALLAVAMNRPLLRAG